MSKCIAKILVLLLLLITTPTFAQFADGEGTPGDPYQIATAAQLLYLANNTGFYDDYFILTDDIDLSYYSGQYAFTAAVIASSTPF